MSVDFDRVKEIIVKQLDIDEDLITKNSIFIDDLGADSIDAVELVMAFENEFKIDIPEEDAEKLLSINDLLIYIDSKS